MMTSLLLLKIIYVLANFLILSDTLLFKYFCSLSTLRKIWILPIISTIWRYYDVRLRQSVNQVMPEVGNDDWLK